MACATVAACFFVGSVNLELHAALPVANDVTLRGLQIGELESLTVTGSSLGHNPRLYAPIRFIQSVTSQSDGSVTFEVTVDESTRPGTYPFRVATDFGLSQPFLIGVDLLPQSRIADTVESLPIAMTGSVTGQQIHSVNIKLDAGQTVSVEVEGRRLGSKLRPSLRAYDPTGRQIRWSKPTRLLQGDARLQFSALSSGTYRVELHDQLYKGPAPGFFRLKIGEFPKRQLAYPIGVTDPKTAIAHWTGDPTSAEFLHVLFRSKFTEWTEETFAEPDANGEFGVSGRIRAKGEVDRYRFNVTPDTKIRCQVWSHRLGTPLDSRLRILDETEKLLGEADDHGRTLDPMVEVAIPAGVTSVTAEVSSHSGSFGENCVYRLEVAQGTAPNPSVRTDVSQITIPAGGQVVLPFRIQRNGSKLPIEISPAGASILHCTPCMASDIEQRCLMEISAPSHTQVVVPVRFLATAGEETNYVNVPALNANTEFPPNLDFVASVTPKAMISAIWESEPFANSFPGGRFAGEISISKPEEHDVALSLITSQSEPNEKERESKQIRLENVKPVTDGFQFDIFVPVRFFRSEDSRLEFRRSRADLKSQDGKQVLGSAFTRLRTSTARKGVAASNRVLPCSKSSKSARRQSLSSRARYLGCLKWSTPLLSGCSDFQKIRKSKLKMRKSTLRPVSLH